MSKAAHPRTPTGKKHRFNKPWMKEHVNDHWVQEAQRLGYRSRAAFKLTELAEKDKLLRPGMTVVDLGGEDLGKIAAVGLALPGGDLGEPPGFCTHGGPGQFAGGGVGRAPRPGVPGSGRADRAPGAVLAFR